MEHSGGMVPFICYYRKVRSSICISQKPYNGKSKLHWTYNAIKTNKQKKRAHYSLRAQLFQPLCDPSGNNWKKRRSVCFSIGWLLSGRINCTEQMWFGAHQNTNECRSLLQKHNSKEGISGLAWLRPHGSEGTWNPNLGKYWRNPKHLRADRWESDCGSHVNCRDHQISQFLPTLLSSPRWSVTKHDVRRCGACVPDRV